MEHRTTRRIWSGLPLALGLLLLTRCSGGNSLSGSVSQLFGNLEFNSVNVWRDDDAFQVSYYFTEFGNTDLVIQLTVELAGLDFSPGKTINLSGTVNGAPRATVVHMDHAEGPVNLPPIKSGTLTLNSGGQPGQETTGSFALSFVNDGQLGGGYTVSGSFDATLSSAQFAPDANYPADAGPDGGIDAGSTASAGGTTAGATGTGAAASASAGTSGGASSTAGAGTSSGAAGSSTGTAAGATSAASASAAGATGTAGASSTAGATGTAGASSTGGASSSAGSSTGGTTSGGCSATTCPPPGVCGPTNGCCASGPGATVDGGACTSDCDCVDVSCTTMICD